MPFLLFPSGGVLPRNSVDRVEVFKGDILHEVIGRGEDVAATLGKCVDPSLRLLASFAGFDDIDMIVTDRELPPEMTPAVEEHGISVIAAQF